MINEKINWKEKYEELQERYYKKYGDSFNKRELIAWIIFFSFVAIVLTLMILLFCGAFDNPIDELNLDKDSLVKEHVIKYYPEYKDCNIKYNNCIKDNSFYCNKGIEIHCDKLENRDGLKVSTETKPTEMLYFDDLTLKDILINKINEEYE